MRTKKMVPVVFLSFFILLLSGCSTGGVSQEEYDQVVAEKEELSNMLSESNDMLQEYINRETDTIMESSSTIIYEAIASTIDEDATCIAVNDKIVQIVVPMEGSESIESFEDKLSDAAYSIGVAMVGDSNEFTTCFIAFVNQDGMIQGGFSLGPDQNGDVTAETIINIDQYT